MRRHHPFSLWGAKRQPDEKSGNGSLRLVPASVGSDDALDMAVRLYRSPGLARNIRRAPLPTGVILVIRVAAGCPESCARASEATGLDVETVTRIASLYLLVALFEQQADAYRTLGLMAGATSEQVQDHRKWLLKWLHPDRNRNQSLSGLPVRVLAASAELVRPLQAAAAIPPAQPQHPAAPPEVRKRRKLRGRWFALPLGH